MAAVAAAWAVNVPWDNIAQGLSTFISDIQGVPGRFNVFDYKGATLIADYGHNPDAIQALVHAVDNMPAQKRVVVISGAGDRRDQDIRDQTQILGTAFDEVILYQDACQRGRTDGEVIQSSSLVALNNGMTIDTLFEQLATMSTSIHIPVVLMGYMNPILQYGFENFCKKAKEVGIDGLILPDLPLFEFEQSYGKIIAENNLDFIFLVTPETPEQRVKKLDSLSNGFLYAVSSSATTGKDKDFNVVAQYLQKLQAMQLKNPILVGFGIKDKATFDAATLHTQGAIIGSAYIQQLTKGGDIETTTSQFLNSVLGA
jgi:tryptophan synthase alpha chain